MEISVLDQQTIQCIMTEEEIADYGMDKKTLFQNDGRVRDFFRQVMQRAQQETGFTRGYGNVAVHAAFLSDESLEITFSVSNISPQQKGKSQISKLQRQQIPAGRDRTGGQDEIPKIDTVIFKSKDLMSLIVFCSKVQAALQAQLYQYKGGYFLLADCSRYEMRQLASLFTIADEYVDAVCYTPSIAAFLREHGKCVIEKSAVGILGRL